MSLALATRWLRASFLNQVGTGSPPMFAQQGQVDWVAFGNTAWSLTSAALQRFSAAEIQPATFGAGLALGCQFNLGKLGQQRVEQALNKLRGRGSFQKILWFGFGYQSFIQLLSANRPGVHCIALCACLADTHSLDVAGYVLQELWHACDFPFEYEPSHEQFTKLVKACQGVFATSTFGETVEMMTGTEGLEARTTQRNFRQSSNWDHCAEPSGTAKVLRALFDISAGQVESITVSGFGECAFIGALAEWLFDLNVCVDGVYNNTPEHQTPQVFIRYTSKDGDAAD